MSETTSITAILARASEGDSASAAKLLPLVYDELRQIAASYLSHEASGHTLQPTALVHEAYLRLVGSDRQWRGRAHFLAAAAMAMRRVLVDHARRKATVKRGRGALRVHLDNGLPAGLRRELYALELNELLERLGSLNERKSRVVEMRIFGGMTLEQIAEVLGVSRSVIHEDWTVARAWLAAELRGK
jgi:RNA polymerase sigma factor (TIGR02999 family)